MPLSLFTLVSHNDDLSNVASNGKIIVNDELEKIWDDTVVVRFKVQSVHVPLKTEDSQGETFPQVNPSLD